MRRGRGVSKAFYGVTAQYDRHKALSAAVFRTVADAGRYSHGNSTSKSTRPGRAAGCGDSSFAAGSARSAR